MMMKQFSLCLLLLVLPSAQGGERRKITVPSSEDGVEQPCYLILPDGFDPQGHAVPLLVSLHSWSGDVEQRQLELEAATEQQGWLYLFPNFRGSNDDPDACGSRLAQQDVLDAVQWVSQRYAVDRARIYLTGSSGGGHMTMLMAARHPQVWAAASAWVGISDLTAWHDRHADDNYGQMLRACCGGRPGDSSQVDQQYRERSPLTHLAGAANLPLDLAAGVHDGHQGSVPIRHTLDAFNIIAKAIGGKTISRQEIDQLSRPMGRLDNPRPSDTADDATFGRAIYLRRSAGKARVTIFEGGHEGLPAAAIAWLGQHRKAEDANRQETTVRKALPPSQRPRTGQQNYFVTVHGGDDANDGSEAKPWRTLAHAVGRLQAGDTLLLREGTYYEPLVVSLIGRERAPIVIRTFPGETAVIDAGLREFYESPMTAWQVADEAIGEYRSTQRYPNLRHVIGSLGDTMTGLNSYYHAQDLRARNELWTDIGSRKDATHDVEPVYCGPGIWYNQATGYIHARLAHTHLEGVENYRGETDPRKLPLALSGIRSTPLLADGAQHVKLQDLVIRGAGYDAIVLRQSSDIELDGLTVWCGSYGLNAVGTQRLKLLNSAFYGSVPPWTFRNDTSLRSYAGRELRDITRLNTHAMLVANAGREHSVYAYPLNDDWEIAHCEFRDGHDGVYLGGISLRFHHNLVHNTQDDGIYLSPIYARYGLPRPQIHIYQNVIRDCLTAFAFGGPELVTTDDVYLYRNLVDLRGEIPTGRPTAAETAPRFSYGKVMGDHGSPPWSTMRVYHNTFVMRERARMSDMALFGAANSDRPRRVFNNLLVHLAGLPAFKPLDAASGQEDGNLYWGPTSGKVSLDSYFDRYRASKEFEASKQAYPAGFSSHSLAVDPGLVRAEESGDNDYRLGNGSPAVDAGVALPMDWPDPYRQQDQNGPDIGLLPCGVEPPRVGPIPAAG